MKNNLVLPRSTFKKSLFARIDFLVWKDLFNLVRKLKAKHQIKGINMGWAVEQALKDFLDKHK